MFNIFEVYLNLLVDPYWQSNALDSILHWSSQDASFKWLDDAQARECLLSGFMLSKVSNLEAALNNYLQLISTNAQALSLMTRDSVVSQILSKLTFYNRNPVVKLSLLRILRQIILQYTKSEAVFNTDAIETTLRAITVTESSVLIQDLVAKILDLLGQLVLHKGECCEPRNPQIVEKEC